MSMNTKQHHRETMANRRAQDFMDITRLWPSSSADDLAIMLSQIEAHRNIWEGLDNSEITIRQCIRDKINRINADKSIGLVR